MARCLYRRNISLSVHRIGLHPTLQSMRRQPFTEARVGFIRHGDVAELPAGGGKVMSDGLLPPPLSRRDASKRMNG